MITIDNDFIKMFRSILKWEWYSDINTCRLFIHMILMANWKSANFKGKEISRGSFVSSIETLSRETNLTIREIRTAILHLKSSGEVTSKATNKYTVFTVVNYDLYQSSDKQSDKRETNERQANDILTTTIEEDKEGKKGRKEIKKGTNVPKEKFVPPSVDEVREYCLERGNHIDPERFVDFYSAKDWLIGKNKMKDWKAAVRTWEKNRAGTQEKPQYMTKEQRTMQAIYEFATSDEESEGLL